MDKILYSRTYSNGPIIINEFRNDIYEKSIPIVANGSVEDDDEDNFNFEVKSEFIMFNNKFYSCIEEIEDEVEENIVKEGEFFTLDYTNDDENKEKLYSRNKNSLMYMFLTRNKII